MSASGSVVQVRRHLAAPAAAVFAAFSEASLVARWLSPSPEVKLTLLEFDFREGGNYRFAYDVPDGRRMIVGGVYRLIRPPSQLVFSWLIEPPDEHAGIESEVVITIAPSSSGSDLHVEHRGWGLPQAEQRHAEGWDGAFMRLAELLELQTAGVD